MSQKFMPLILNCESADINATAKLAFSPLQPTEHSSWTSTWSFTTALAVGIIVTSGVGAGHPHHLAPRSSMTNMDSDSRTDHRHMALILVTWVKDINMIYNCNNVLDQNVPPSAEWTTDNYSTLKGKK